MHLAAQIGLTREFLAQAPGRGDHVGQRRLDLRVGARLQPAVGVDPHPVRGQDPSAVAEQVRDLVDARDPRRVDVVDARAQPAGEAATRRLGEDPSARAGRLDGGHVGVQRVDRGEDLGGVGVAQVRVDLRAVARAGGGAPVRADRPRQVLGLLAAAQRQQLAQRRLVDLDDRDAGGLEVATSSRIASATCPTTSRSGRSWRTNDHATIVTGPVSMPLTGLVGQRLGVLAPSAR